MARKTTKTQSSDPQVPMDSEGFYSIPKDLLMEYRATDSEFRHATLCLRVTQQELGVLLTKAPEIAKKLAEKEATAQESRVRQQSLVEVHRKIEQMFGIKMQDIAIDDVTGRMQKIVEGQPQFDGEGKPAMLKPVQTPATGKRKVKPKAAK